MEIEKITHVLFVFFLATARMQAMFMILPFLSKASLGTSMIRNGVVASLSLITYPMVDSSLSQQEFDSLKILLIILKELAIGLAMGFVIVIPFWAIEAVGFFIDNQRGATMASALNPLSGSVTSPLGILLNQAFVTVFFVSGTFLVMLYSLYKSYVVWPVFGFLPSMSEAGPMFFLSQLDTLMRLVVLLGGPVVIAMFLTEFGLGLVSRFAPQLNVFILSMPLKSAVGIALLVLYVGYILRYFSELLEDTESFLKPVMGVLS